MSNHITLLLHRPEESVSCNFSSVLVPFPDGAVPNPITDYFQSTGSLVKKIIDTKYADDAEILGLLVLGVISSAEFYFRTILSELSRICPLCITHSELVNIPFGSTSYYAGSAYAAAMSAFEHESLADSKKISAEVLRFSGFALSQATSVKKALEDFELLCELRHCFVHARGFVGLKASRALGGNRSVHKILVKQDQALDFIKLSHNAVRAVNHFLSTAMLNRWIDKDVLAGRWKDDKTLFTRYWSVFAKKSEDSYSGSPEKAYSAVKPIVVKRKRGAASSVATA